MKIQAEDTTPRILVVDDVEINLIILRKMIEGIGYIALMASNVKMAIEQMEQTLPQVILTDLSMPETDGYEFINILKENPLTRNIPVIIISGMDSSQQKIQGLKAGAVDFIPKPFDAAEVQVRINTQLKNYQLQCELAHYNQRLNQMLKEQMLRLEEEQKNILFALARATEYSKVQDGYSHLENVSYNSRMLAQSLSLTVEYEDIVTPDFTDTIEIAALLHDIGKIAVPEAVLTKPGRLDAAQMELIRLHTLQGARIIDEIKVSCGQNRFLEMAAEIAMSHHENWNGDGYPNGLAGTEIPLAARIVHIVGVFDTLTNDQVYRPRMQKQEALDIMKSEAGKSFDPGILGIFMRIINQLHE